jgi:hypothetical protein
VAVKLPDLGQMVGPLPLGAWVGVVGGGLGLAYLARRGKPAEEPQLAEVPPFPGTPVTSGPTRLAPAEPAVTEPVVTDNTEWIRQAVTRLVVDGFAPLKTQQCLAQYLEGVVPAHDPNACQPIIEAAIRKVGPPPTGAPVNQFPLGPKPPAPSKPPTTPATPTAPRFPLRPVALYWYGLAMYLTNGQVRTRYGLRKAEADRYRRRYPVLNKSGSPGGPGKGYPIHDAIPVVARPQDIAPIP